MRVCDTFEYIGVFSIHSSSYHVFSKVGTADVVIDLIMSEPELEAGDFTAQLFRQIFCDVRRGHAIWKNHFGVGLDLRLMYLMIILYV